jgi:hypothetical protein
VVVGWNMPIPVPYSFLIIFIYHLSLAGGQNMILPDLSDLRP